MCSWRLWERWRASREAVGGGNFSDVKVLIVRDRESSGGGIHNYYRNVTPFLEVDYRLKDVGKPHHYFGAKGLLTRFTPIRLLLEWLGVLAKTVWFRPDIVHVNPGLDALSMRAMRRDAVTIRISRLCGCKVVVFWRGWEADWVGKASFPGGNDGWICRSYQKAAAQIVLASRFKSDLRNWGFEMPIHVETTVADQVCVEGCAERAPGPKDHHLLFLSRVEETKGVFELVEAHRILRGRGHACGLTIAGDGPGLEALKRHVAESGMEGVEFPGYVTGDAKAACYRRGTIFCFPSSHGEGMPNAVLEAMAAGLPVVASTVGGLQDILEEGRTGFLIERTDVDLERRRFDPEAIADAIERLLADPELHARISGHNAAYAKERFAPAKVAKRLEGIYREVMDADA